MMPDDPWNVPEFVVAGLSVEEPTQRPASFRSSNHEQQVGGLGMERERESGALARPGALLSVRD